MSKDKKNKKRYLTPNDVIYCDGVLGTFDKNGIFHLTCCHADSSFFCDGLPIQFDGNDKPYIENEEV